MQVLSRQRGASLIEVSRIVDVSRVATRRHLRGFTLIELVVTMAVALVLLMIAVPSFKTITLSSKLTATANDVVGAVRIARMEAIKRNSSTQLCSNDATTNTTDALGTACGTQAGAVYVLINSQAIKVRDGITGLTTPLQLSGTMAAIRFTGQGLGYTPGNTTLYAGTVADICTSSMSSNSHRVISMTAGSLITTTTPTTAGTCP